MFNVGQNVEVIKDNDCNLFLYDVHTVQAVKPNFVKVGGKWYTDWRFGAVSTVNPVNNTLEDKFITEVTIAIEDRIETEGLDACDQSDFIDNDSVIGVLLDLADNLGFDVNINLEPKVSVTKR